MRGARWLSCLLILIALIFDGNAQLFERQDKDMADHLDRMKARRLKIAVVCLCVSVVEQIY